MTQTLPVSVVIPCYRSARTVERAVRSVALQTQRPAELIVVDDASGDETPLLLKAVAARYAGGWLRLELLTRNVGAASARNRGWEMAVQPYIAFLDADDAWHPRKLEIQYAFMQANPEVVLSGHGYRRLDFDTTPAWPIATSRVKPIRKWAMLLSNRFVTPSVMIRRDAKQRFEEGQRHMEDHMLWMKLVSDGAAVFKLGVDLAATYKKPYGAGGLSGQFWAMECGELENYRQLHRTNRIRAFQLAGLYIFSWLKFVRRLLMLALRSGRTQ